MRFGLVPVTSAFMPLRRLARRVGAVEEAGLEICWFEQGERDRAPLVTAAMAAAVTSDLRLGGCVDAGPNPVGLAEEAAVLDLASNGRVILGLRSADPSLLGETVEVVQRAFTTRPFRHHGERWTFPANLEGNEDVESRIRVTPAPIQIDLPIWLAGEAAKVVSAATGLPALIEGPASVGLLSGDEMAEDFAPGAQPALIDLDSTQVDPDLLVARLLRLRDERGADSAIVRPPAGIDDSAFESLVAVIASEVRPRVQLHSLAPALEGYWGQTLSSRD